MRPVAPDQTYWFISRSGSLQEEVQHLWILWRTLLWFPQEVDFNTTLFPFCAVPQRRRALDSTTGGRGGRSERLSQPFWKIHQWEITGDHLQSRQRWPAEAEQQPVGGSAPSAVLVRVRILWERTEGIHPTGKSGGETKLQRAVGVRGHGGDSKKERSDVKAWQPWTSAPPPIKT